MYVNSKSTLLSILQEDKGSIRIVKNFLFKNIPEVRPICASVWEKIIIIYLDKVLFLDCCHEPHTHREGHLVKVEGSVNARVICIVGDLWPFKRTAVEVIVMAARITMGQTF